MGFEPTTSGTTIQRSNQLNYNHHVFFAVANIVFYFFQSQKKTEIIVSIRLRKPKFGTNILVMKRFIIALMLFLAFQSAHAQGFTQSVGIRAGIISPGFEYRLFTDDLNSYKLLLSSRDQGLQLHAMKEFHRYDLFSFSPQLVFVFGGGAHVGYQRWDERHYRPNFNWTETLTAVIAGIDGLAALEYVFYEVPISVGVEVKPYLDLFGRESFDTQLFDFAFTAKYLF